MTKSTAIVLCLDSISEKNGVPTALQILECGVPALDYLLHLLRANDVSEIVVVCSESAHTRYFAHYALLRNVEIVSFSREKLSSVLNRNGIRIVFNGNCFLDNSVNISELLTGADSACAYYSNEFAISSFLPDSYIVTAVNGDTTDSILSSVSENSVKVNMHESKVYSLTSESDLLIVNQYLVSESELQLQGLPEVVEEHCHARIGMMGNPSDGFNGKTVSFLLENFRASVCVESRARELGVEIVDPLQFSSVQDLQLQSNLIGYTSGGRLLQATCKVFSQLCFKNNLLVHMLKSFRMTYDTNIPRMVGLSGSSAIIVAAFRALLKFYGLTIDDFHINLHELPQHILDIEKVELGISAGLQDRVIQTYGGLVFMDFTKPPTDSSRYTPLDPQLLPPMYLAYDACAGGDSGKVHSTVKDRWAQQDPELVQGMQALGGYAQEAKLCLESGDVCRLAELMEANFAMRRKLYGDAVVGDKNIRMVELAQRHGMSAKFTGSGGALLCIQSNGWGWLDVEEEAALTAEYQKEGFNFERIRIPGDGKEPAVKYLTE